MDEPQTAPEVVGPARLSRRQALRLLGAALLAGACGAPARTARRAAGPGSRPSATIATTTTRLPAPPATATTTATGPADPTTTTQPPEPPAPQAEDVRVGPLAGFVAFGDFGGGPAQRAVAQAMLRWVAAGHCVDALVTTGDNVYDFGEPHLFAAHLDEPYRELRAGNRPMWVTLGNHDVIGGHGAVQLAHLGLPPLPYTTALPGVRLLFLDGTRPDLAQAAWLDAQLAQPGPPFSVAVFHPPVYSCGIHGPEPAVVANWAPVLESHRVGLVLNGHDHLYHRFVSPGGVTYVVTGGGGRGLYPHTAGCHPPELRASAVRHHFSAVEVYADRLVLTAVADDDTVLDQAEIPALAALPVR